MLALYGQQQHQAFDVYVMRYKVESIHTTVKAFGKSLRLEIRPYKYDNDRIALIAFADGEQYGVITVNIPEADLADDEIIVKTYSENEHWVPQLVEQLPDVFQDTGKRIQSGHITVQVWRYTPQG